MLMVGLRRAGPRALLRLSPVTSSPSLVMRCVPVMAFRVLSSKTPFPINHKEVQEKRDYEKLPKWKQWAIYFQSEEFKKGMTLYYVGGFIAMLVTFYFYMRDRYYEDKQLKIIKKKYEADPASLSEYEYLKLKALSQESLKPKEAKKFKIYQMMRKEFRRKNILDIDAIFNPTPSELDEWYSKQVKPKTKRAPDISSEEAVEEEEKSKEPVPLTNASNPHVVAAQDTTDFYEKKAQEYDDEVKWEERGILMGRRRNWLMNQATGDVLEIACGTGRNIPYIKCENIASITFLDSSRKMLEVAQKKFKDSFPSYHKAAFTVGKAEDLVSLAQDSSKMKYDTVIEAFGLCAHEDPVKALKNMAELLKPGGRIVLLEHGRSTWDFINNHLDFRSEKRMKTWACRWNLDIGELVDDAGLDITFEKRVHFGTTWLLVCKRAEDPIKMEEKPFMNKLLGTEFKPIKRN